MMKNNHYPQTEIENLSAYLDHELNEAEEAQLRSRLAQDASLREALEDMRLTRYTLQHTPNVRRQRSFVLSPEMVRQQKSAWRAFSFSRTIAVAASVLFALVFGGQVLFGGSAGMLSAASQETVAMDVYNETTANNGEAPMMMEAAPAEEMAEDTAAAAADDSMMTGLAESATEEPAAEMMPAPTETMAPQPTMDMTQPPSGGGGLPPSPTEAVKVAEPTVEEPTDESMSAALAPPDEGTGAADSRIADEGRITPEEGMAEDTTMAETELQTSEPIPAIRWVQTGLLVLALLGAGLAIYFRRRVL